jgi:ankyrin repeat protein
MNGTSTSTLKRQSVEMPIRLSPQQQPTTSASFKNLASTSDSQDQHVLEEIRSSLQYKSQPRDSGYESRQGSIISTRSSGQIRFKQSQGSRSQSRTRRSSRSSQRSLVRSQGFEIGNLSASSSAAPPIVNVSTLFKICCNGVHNSGRVITDKNFVCTNCGLAYVHSVGLHAVDMGPNSLNACLFDTLAINKTDKVGNNILHYAGITRPTKGVLQQINKPGLNFEAVNTCKQSWLHCFNGTRLGHDLFSILRANENILLHRDIYGRTILMGLLEAPLKQDICRRLIEVFPPLWFIIKDSSGRNASIILLDTYQRYSSTSNESENEVLQTISIFQEHANTMHDALTVLHYNDPDERRVDFLTRAGLVNSAILDIDGSNALQCLAYHPPGHTSFDEIFRYNQIELYVNDIGMDLDNFDNSGNPPLTTYIKSLDPTRNDDSIARIIDFLITKGANPNLRDRDGKTALYHACTGGWLQCVEVLLKYGSRVNVRATPSENLTSDEDMMKGESLLQATYDAHSIARKQYMQPNSGLDGSLPERLHRIICLLTFCGTVLNPMVEDEWGLGPDAVGLQRANEF